MHTVIESTLKTTELQSCQNYVALLETNLAEKSHALYMQIMYNTFTMIIGVAVGLLLAYSYSLGFFKKSK